MMSVGEAEIPEEGGDVIEQLEELEETPRKETGHSGDPCSRPGGSRGLGEWGGAGGLARIDARGARKDHAIAHFLEGANDPGDVDGLRAGAPGAEVVEEWGMMIDDVRLPIWAVE